jgi:hypothetical protein
MAARCGKSKPRPGTPRRGAKFGFNGVPTSGGANALNAPGLVPVPRGCPANPRPAPEKLRAGAENPCMGAEEPRPCPEAEIAKPTLSATANPNLDIVLTMAVEAE